jgi:pentatricopeptide repeat protein
VLDHRHDERRFEDAAADRFIALVPSTDPNKNRPLHRGRFFSAAEVAPLAVVEQNSDFQHMAQPGITAKIEELQFRIKTDPKSRLFFPLAEEFRKNGKLAEAEQVLRTGLGVHSTYLSAWVSLGRVLREQHKNAEAVEALTKALQVDPGNVVAARLLADAYLDLGEKVEAIKKYKLVHALMPSDEELEARIDQLDRDLSPAPVAPPQSEPEPEPVFAETADVPFAQVESPFDDTMPTLHTSETPFDTGDEIPMAAQHEESPFEEPSGYTAAALEVEHLDGMHVEEAPLVAEVPTVWTEEADADVFAPSEPEAAPQEEDDVTSTTTMADLYVRQGLVGEARKIYQHMLERDPSNGELRSKLNALDESPADSPAAQLEAAPSDDEIREPGNPATLHNHAKIVVLQQWLTKVAKRELPSA